MWENGVKGQEGTDSWLLSLETRTLLATVSLTAAWQRNLFHSKRCLNGTANSATTCKGRPRQLGNGGLNKALMPAQAASLSPYKYGRGNEKWSGQVSSLLAERAA